MVFNYSLSLNIGYWITDNVRLFFETSINQTLHRKAFKGTAQWDTPDGDIITENFKYTGMSNIYYSFGVGLTVGF